MVRTLSEGITAALVNGSNLLAGLKRGRLFNFDGSSGYLNLGNWFSNQTFTISMWVNPGASQQNSADIIDNNRTASASWGLEYQNTGLSYNWLQTWGSGSLGANAFLLASNGWQHLTVSVDSTFMSRVYVNGVLVNNVQMHPINL